jgi:hypothetical protein
MVLYFVSFYASYEAPPVPKAPAWCSFTTWKVSYNLLNLRKQFTEGFSRAIFVSP